VRILRSGASRQEEAATSASTGLTAARRRKLQMGVRRRYALPERLQTSNCSFSLSRLGISLW
jgi:hypothetical protein